MRAILIDINCGPVNCDRCEHLRGYLDAEGMVCDIFLNDTNDPDTEYLNEPNMPRPAGCLDAEQKAKEVTTTPQTKLDDAESLSTTKLGMLTVMELGKISMAIHKERCRRHDEDYRAKGICPECGGCGYDGNEMAGHTRCRRCQTTGKYVPT